MPKKEKEITEEKVEEVKNENVIKDEPIVK